MCELKVYIKPYTWCVRVCRIAGLSRFVVRRWSFKLEIATSSSKLIHFLRYAFNSTGDSGRHLVITITCEPNLAYEDLVI